MHASISFACWLAALHYTTTQLHSKPKHYGYCAFGIQHARGKHTYKKRLRPGSGRAKQAFGFLSSRMMPSIDGRQYMQCSKQRPPPPQPQAVRQRMNETGPTGGWCRERLVHK
ncbi:hypothetical protein LY76DRAFT_285612 [Colletotrichum caudatum]|nr:hypothetical protein LY76DRAFT_285612 [Colletotrichum caudatum]